MGEGVLNERRSRSRVKERADVGKGKGKERRDGDRIFHRCRKKRKRF